MFPVRAVARSSRFTRSLIQKPNPLPSLYFSRTYANNYMQDPPRGIPPQTPARSPRPTPAEGRFPEDSTKPAVYLGTKQRLPEFVLTDKVVLVSGAARGLGLTTAEALLEAGATGEYCLIPNH